MKSKNEIIDFENSIAPWLGKTVKIVEYYLQEAFNTSKIDLTKEQMIVLKKLHDQDGLHQNELAFLTLRDKSTLTRLLSKMENKNYISRKKSKKDKRINNVYLTDLGREIFEKTKPVIRYIIDTMEQNISTKEKEQIINILKKIQSNFDVKSKTL
jgi:DNA-binding MarR family transcriptional regulator